MRLPWEQIAMEVIEVSAPELAAKLDISEAEAGWGIILSIKWALARCPDHQPPSANAVVKGSTAARQIARAAGYKGDPDAYMQAATTLAFPTLELVDGGIRFRGLDRYDAAWSDRNREAWKAWKVAHPERYPTAPPSPPASPPEPRRNSAGTPPGSRRSDPDPDPDADPSSPPPPREPPKLVVVGKKTRKLTVSDLTPAQRAKWDRIQRGRDDKRLLRETDPPATFPAWSDELDAQEVVEPQWVHSLTLYLRDDHFKERLWPTAVFITPGVWRQRLPVPPEEVML